MSDFVRRLQSRAYFGPNFDVGDPRPGARRRSDEVPMSSIAATDHG